MDSCGCIRPITKEFRWDFGGLKRRSRVHKMYAVLIFLLNKFHLVVMRFGN